MINIVVCGAAGKMGQAILSCAIPDKEVVISGALESPGHSWVGRTLSEVLGGDAPPLIVTADSAQVFAAADAAISFSSVEGSIQHIIEAAKKHIPMVIGTTGFSVEQEQQIYAAAEMIPVCISPNMSIGVNLLFELVKIAAAKLDKNYDIEIIETHHRFKKDSPSGTAKRLAENIAQVRGIDLEKKGVYGRKGLVGARQTDEIGMHAVRAGDIIGDHTVLFSSLGERIELVHKAHTRNAFAHGALRAAKFLIGKKPGVYTMADVLGLK